jgi:type VI secretion system secreted protein VgrG
VFNGDNKYPYKLPDNKTQSGVKSDSSKGHGGYNEFMFEDKKGSEQIRAHAQKDLDVVVLHAETRTVGEKFEAPTGQASHQVIIKKGDDDLKLETGSRDTDIALMDHLKAGVSITLECGTSKITMTPAFIKIESTLVQLSGALIMIN